MVCDDSKKALSLLKLKSKLETIVLIDDLTDEVRERASEANVKVFRMTDLYEIGKSSLAEPVVSKYRPMTSPHRDSAIFFSRCSCSCSRNSRRKSMTCAQYATRVAQLACPKAPS